MIVMEVENLELLQFGDQNHKVGGGLHTIPRTSDLFPTDGPVDDFIDFESRILSQIQLYGSSGTTTGKSKNTNLFTLEPNGRQFTPELFMILCVAFNNHPILFSFSKV